MIYKSHNPTQSTRHANVLLKKKEYMNTFGTTESNKLKTSTPERLRKTFERLRPSADISTASVKKTQTSDFHKQLALLRNIHVSCNLRLTMRND
jgi:GTP cyclohydrolase I